MAIPLSNQIVDVIFYREVEALIRYTENLGFDAVYYQYNSMNQVIRLTVVDPLRRYTTWYGYDHNGRVDSVWTKLEAVGSGLWDPGTAMWASPSTPVDRDADAEITYAYTPTGQVDTMFYPRINTQTVYKYSPRKWLDTLVANKGFTDIFKEYLTFDPTGQILQQRSQQGSGLVLVQDYSYDALGQLTNWTRNPGTGSQATEEYDYDSVGNRILLTNRNNMGVVSSWRTYDIGRRASLSVGPNQMIGMQNRTLPFGAVTTSQMFGYDPDGSLVLRKQFSGTSTLLQEENFSYSSWRGLNWKYHRSTPRPSGGPLEWEWRYRYNAMGEREQKREVLTPNGDDVASQGYKWNYYLLGGSREQLNLWEGLQTSDGTFCDLPSGGGSYVHLYPSEYLVYGVEYPGVKEDVPRLRLFPDNTQEYRITDHLASVRATLDGTGAITHTYDYKPFGSLFQGGPEARQSFNSREKDQEAGLFNNGVRKLEDDDGRFTSIDPLWEKFASWSPYQYGYNNPMSMTDPGGKQAREIAKRAFAPEGGNGGGGGGFNLFSQIERGIQGAIIRAGYAGMNAESVRNQYNNAIKRLDPSDGKARSAIKSEMRAKSSPESRYYAEALRPSSGEVARQGGTANKSNSAVNRQAKTLGTFGKIFIAIGIINSVENIADAEDKAEAVAEETGAWTGALAGGEIGAKVGGFIGSFASPLGGAIGAIVGGLVGGLVGGAIGAYTAKEVYNEVTE